MNTFDNSLENLAFLLQSEIVFNIPWTKCIGDSLPQIFDLCLRIKKAYFCVIQLSFPIFNIHPSAHPLSA